ncbi:LETM1-related biofilm-associated protein [Xanthomarina sp. F2636L]|uniref:LETM1-related biofilm-associated protein n=1 Tax=Xanthomarina sp. F2636L TaxID=2996018 RepID=UPI00225E5088|nr:LETM1-related biofilm-associated protein [Xanthomarina sp. F2636L]MCX7550120.1 LETM1-related biofilm-associated protein [Xanthomarina sp. F2636L]
MNPSASGWIKKLLNEIDSVPIWINTDYNSFYDSLRESGFIYGSNIKVVKDYFNYPGLTEEEICKVNFLLALNFIFEENKTSDSNFVESVINFYSEINAYSTSVFSELLGEKKTASLLEKIIHKRIQIDDNLIDRSFNYFITNALLFTDILAYKAFLQTQEISEKHIQHLESAIESIVSEVLNSKNKKSEYDRSLIKLVEQSIRYKSHKTLTYQEALEFINTDLEKYYIMDIASMATWGDLNIDKSEKTLLLKLGKKLNLEQQRIDNSIQFIETFYNNNKDKIALLSSQNIVKTFYSNSSKMVSKLISRNSKRLQKELLESKELMVLLSKSTVRDLSEEEHKKVQAQLLDIFKSIPSLAIFMLPGGALLLPLVIKFIPKLLPSSFDDNRIEE